MTGTVAYAVRVEIGADEVRTARLRAGYRTQGALADALGVSLRLVQKWEKEGVGERYEHDVRKLLFPATPPTSLAGFSDFELLIELGRRLDRVAMREAEMLARTFGDPRVPQEADTPSHDTPEQVDTVSAGSEDIPRTSRGRRSAPGVAGPTRRRRNDAESTD